MKNPEDIKESVKGVMSDSEMIKSLQDDLKKARDDRDRLVDGFNEAQEKNLKYEAIAGWFKKHIIDTVNEANEVSAIDYDGAIDLDELEEKINRRFDINQYQDDVDLMIKEYITYDQDFETIVTDKIYEALKNCRITLNESRRGE